MNTAVMLAKLKRIRFSSAGSTRFLPSLFCAAMLSIAPSLHASEAETSQVGDPAKGKEKAATCMSCHGPNGNSANPEWPSLAGQHASYIFKQLQNFHSGERQNAMMSGMAAALSEQDMRDLAAYYAKQDWQPAGTADPELVALGQSIFQGGDFDRNVPACTGCHSPVGSGNPAAAYPLVRGQHAKYTELQLHAFRKGERANDPNAMMRQAVSKMSDKQIQAVASYLQGLRP